MFVFLASSAGKNSSRTCGSLTRSAHCASADEPVWHNRPPHFSRYAPAAQGGGCFHMFKRHGAPMEHVQKTRHAHGTCSKNAARPWNMFKKHGTPMEHVQKTRHAHATWLVVCARLHVSGVKRDARHDTIIPRRGHVVGLLNGCGIPKLLQHLQTAATSLNSCSILERLQHL
eukprot:364938-Chlamydomonas_euryale.AAC.11